MIKIVTSPKQFFIMKKYFFVVCFLWTCTSQAQKIVLTPTEFQKKVKETSDAIVLDVRTPEEIAEGHIENSQSIVYDDLFDKKLEGLQHKPLFVYCASGKRSAKAAKILRDKGYNRGRSHGVRLSSERVRPNPGFLRYAGICRRAIASGFH